MVGGLHRHEIYDVFFSFEIHLMFPGDRGVLKQTLKNREEQYDDMSVPILVQTPERKQVRQQAAKAAIRCSHLDVETTYYYIHSNHYLSTYNYKEGLN